MTFYPTHARPGRQTMSNTRPGDSVPFENVSPLWLMSGNRRRENERARTSPVRH